MRSLSLLLVAATALLAQADNWPLLRGIYPGQDTHVHLLDGKRHSGGFISTTDANLVIRVPTGDQTFAKEWAPIVDQLMRSGILSKDAIASEQGAQLLRHAAEAMGRAVQTSGGAKQARDWLSGHQPAVKALEFQCDALRQNLEKVETGYESEREALEASLTAAGRELEAQDRRLKSNHSSLWSKDRLSSWCADSFRGMTRPQRQQPSGSKSHKRVPSSIAESEKGGNGCRRLPIFRRQTSTRSTRI